MRDYVEHEYGRYPWARTHARVNPQHDESQPLQQVLKAIEKIQATLDSIVEGKCAGRLPDPATLPAPEAQRLMRHWSLLDEPLSERSSEGALDR